VYGASVTPETQACASCLNFDGFGSAFLVLSIETRKRANGCRRAPLWSHHVRRAALSGWMSSRQIIDETCLENEKFMRRSRGTP